MYEEDSSAMHLLGVSNETERVLFSENDLEAIPPEEMFLEMLELTLVVDA